MSRKCVRGSWIFVIDWIGELCSQESLSVGRSGEVLHLGSGEIGTDNNLSK